MQEIQAGMERALPEQLRENDIIDLYEILSDPTLETDVDEADLLYAKYENAVVESVELAEPWAGDPSQRLVIIVNDICNVAVPQSRPVLRVANA